MFHKSFHQQKALALRKYGSCRVKPQLIFSDLANERRKLNKLDTFHTLVHPYFPQIESFELRDYFIKPVECSPKSPPKIARNGHELRDLVCHLRKMDVIAVDLEFTDTETYLAYTCLIQISTPYEDFLLDPLAIYPIIHSYLNPIFISEEILKVFHSGSDLTALQRDFGIFSCNVVEELFHFFNPQSHSIAFDKMIYELFNVTLTNLGKYADWRVRPFHPELMNYAKNDSHYLIRAYYDLVKKIPQVTEHTFAKSIDQTFKVYKFPHNKPVTTYWHGQLSQIKDIKFAHSHDMTLQVFTLILALRKDLAKETDCKPHEIMSDSNIFHLATQWPKNEETLSSILQPKTLSKQFRGKILHILHSHETATQFKIPNLNLFLSDQSDSEDEIEILGPPSKVPKTQEDDWSASLVLATETPNNIKSPEPIRNRAEFPDIQITVNLS